MLVETSCSNILQLHFFFPSILKEAEGVGQETHFCGLLYLNRCVNASGLTEGEESRTNCTSLRSSYFRVIAIAVQWCGLLLAAVTFS
jgi:hypothetical protein